MSDRSDSDDVHEILAPADTLRGYDRWAARYDDGGNPMVAATAWALDRAPLAVAGARVVELGCGTGRLAPVVLAAGARAYVGVDGSRGMLDRARARVADPRCAWCEAELAAAADACAGEPFDLALLVLVLEHVAALAPVFAAAARLVRPGGALRVVEIHPDLVAGGTVAHFDDGGGEVRFTSTSHPVRALRAAVTAAGFAIDRLDEHTADGELLARVPQLAKHRRRLVLVDLAATRA